MKKYLLTASVVGMILSVAAPAALASGGDYNNGTGSAWTSVTTDQYQQYESCGCGLDPVVQTSAAEVVTKVWFGDQAEAVSKTEAAQSQGALAIKAAQGQKTKTGAAVTWEKGKWPSFTIAKTTGGAWQGQTVWGAEVEQDQVVKTWQGGRVGVDEEATVYEIDGVAQNHQIGLAPADYAQENDIDGSGQAQGYTNPPFPKKLSYNFGGKILQFIDLSLQNIVTW